MTSGLEFVAGDWKSSKHFQLSFSELELLMRFQAARLWPPNQPRHRQPPQVLS